LRKGIFSRTLLEERIRLPMKLELSDLDRVAALFRVFSEATRLALLQELKEGPKPVGELVAALPATTQANISKQLKQLHDAGLVARHKHGTSVIYEIAEPLVFELCRLACEKLNRPQAVRKLAF
jgi:DNA-binding transcriptional ArsR family regulator